MFHILSNLASRKISKCEFGSVVEENFGLKNDSRGQFRKKHFRQKCRIREEFESSQSTTLA